LKRACRLSDANAPHGDLAAARQSDLPRFLVGDPVVQKARLLTGEDALRDLHHGTLHAAARHGSHDLPVLAENHLRAVRRGRGLLRLNDGGHRHTLAALRPGGDAVGDVAHSQRR